MTHVHTIMLSIYSNVPCHSVLGEESEMM